MGVQKTKLPKTIITQKRTGWRKQLLTLLWILAATSLTDAKITRTTTLLRRSRIIKKVKENYRGDKRSRRLREAGHLYKDTKIKLAIYRLELKKMKKHEALQNLSRRQYEEGKLHPSTFLQRSIRFIEAQIAAYRAISHLLAAREKLIQKCLERDNHFLGELQYLFTRYIARAIINFFTYIMRDDLEYISTFLRNSLPTISLNRWGRSLINGDS